MSELNEKYLLEAYKLAEIAAKNNEVPVGCVIVKDGKIIARGRNYVEEKKDSTAHAEIIAIKKAQKKIGDWRLNGCDLYVTLEPCCACAGAIVNARVSRVFFGCYDKVFGGAESCHHILSTETAYWKTEFTGGILQEKCAMQLKRFFKKRREEK